ncbi:MAG: hypothetical protein EPO08_09020 [Rhodospirillaceae bacterium]|nr:MAG: hypothetical protein EPO08_09020 [Rhodospirillaceae bacterium]
MFRFLVQRMITAFEKRYDYDASYLRAMYDISPVAFRKFGAVTKLAAHREVVPVAASYAAKLVGTLIEDCGPCTQIVVNMAREAGMNDAQIEAVLKADLDAMAADTALGFRFATAIVSGSADADEARQAVRARWGERGVVDLTFALQGSRIYPMVKAGLGFATACQRISVGSRAVDIIGRAA